MTIAVNLGRKATKQTNKTNQMTSHPLPYVGVKGNLMGDIRSSLRFRFDKIVLF